MRIQLKSLHFDKPERRVAPITPDYVGCDVPDEFVVGYGLDYDQKYRNLPYIGQLRRSVYENKYSKSSRNFP